MSKTVFFYAACKNVPNSIIDSFILTSICHDKNNNNFHIIYYFIRDCASFV